MIPSDGFIVREHDTFINIVFNIEHKEGGSITAPNKFNVTVIASNTSSGLLDTIYLQTFTVTGTTFSTGILLIIIFI